MLYVAFLIDSKRKSTTIKCYVSAIKAVLKSEGVKICQDNEVLGMLIHACKLKNDIIQTRLPICRGLLEVLINSVEKIFDPPQPYLSILYRALLATTYFGLFRVGELTQSKHVVRAKDVHIALNKDKLMFILRSSKTHGKGEKPQLIKIEGLSVKTNLNKIPKSTKKQGICPFNLLKMYLSCRPSYNNESEQFFVFSYRSPVLPIHFRRILTKLLKYNKLNHSLYCTHGLRLGMASDLLEGGVSVETIRKLGRWKSNAVYTYLRS